MASFIEVIQPLVYQLQSMGKFSGGGANTYTLGTKKFRHHTHDVGPRSPSHFQGKGAAAFVKAVNRNADFSTQAVATLSEFQQFCDSAWKTMESLSEPYDSESRYLDQVPLVDEPRSSSPYDTYEYQYFLNIPTWGPSAARSGDVRLAVVRDIRETILPGLRSQLDTLLDSRRGPDLLEGEVNNVATTIQGYFDSYEEERYEYLNDALKNKLIDYDEYNYYSRMVVAAHDSASQVAQDIAMNMKAGYDQWDAQFIAAARHFLSQVENIDKELLEIWKRSGLVKHTNNK